MVEEKVYILEDSAEMILIEKLIFKERRYLLLNERNTDNIFVAYEDNNKLNFLDEKDNDYKKIFSMLIEKHKSND